MSRTIVIDQSSTCMGYALLDGAHLIPGAHGYIIAEKSGLKAAGRLWEMLMDIQGLITKYAPSEMLIEKQHYHGMHNSPTIEAVAWASGICEMAAYRFSIPVYRVRPQEWREACGIKGKKDTVKEITRRMMAQYWNIPEGAIKKYDHSDALGMAAFWAVKGDEMKGLKK